MSLYHFLLTHFYLKLGHIQPRISYDQRFRICNLFNRGLDSSLGDQLEENIFLLLFFYDEYDSVLFSIFLIKKFKRKKNNDFIVRDKQNCFSIESFCLKFLYFFFCENDYFIYCFNIILCENVSFECIKNYDLSVVVSGQIHFDDVLMF